MRKTAVLLGGVLALGGAGAFSARALATHATVAVDPGPPPCVAVSVAIDGTPVNVDQKHCAPASAPDLPAPTIPLPATPAVDVPPLPLPKVDVPSVTLPALPAPSLPSLPSLPSAPALPSVTVPAAATGLCNFDPARPTPPPASEQTVTLPGGTTIFHNLTIDPSTNTVSGYLGGTNPLLGTLEGGGTGSPAGVTGQIDGNNVQTGLSGYAGTSGYCLGK